MKLDKAIEILQLETNTASHQSDPDFYDALSLGIQALIAIRDWRLDWQGNRFHCLPGETEPPRSIIPVRLIFGQPKKED